MTSRTVLILLGLAFVFTVNAQQAAPASEPAASTPKVEKFQIINPGEMNQRCTSEALVKCLKTSKAECEAAANASAETANAEIDKATGGKTLTAFDAGFYQGQALGAFMAEMQKRTGNRFIKCLQKN
jgi:hypothetical protein